MKNLLALPLLLSLTTLCAIELKVDMGTGLFYSGAKGRIDYVETSFENSYAKTDLQTSSQVYIWADFTTSNPYIPKVRLEYLKVSADGDSLAHLESGNPKFQAIIDEWVNNSIIKLNDQVWKSHLQHNVYDASLYYEFFEKDPWPSIGLGLGYRYFDYIYIMDVDLLPGLQMGDRDSSSAPMLFLTSRYDIPAVNLGFQGDGKVYVFGDSEIYDYQVKLDLMFDITEKSSAGLEFGYRYQYYNLLGEDVEKVKGNMKYQGIFIGAVINFK